MRRKERSRECLSEAEKNMEFEVHDNTDTAFKANEITYSDKSSGELSGDGSDSNYLASNSEDEDRNIETEDEVWKSCEK
ncbi:hypothetical protein RIF29_19486 [Crotalaria pallida]|uniref:Uncharacterized protein n=1 Tax=Crotalaria pallida TaxID=3830 RepID=A0AAN9I6J9_CROPI